MNEIEKLAEEERQEENRRLREKVRTYQRMMVALPKIVQEASAAEGCEP